MGKIFDYQMQFQNKIFDEQISDYQILLLDKTFDEQNF